LEWFKFKNIFLAVSHPLNICQNFREKNEGKVD
jgi:hypothetical protein